MIYSPPMQELSWRVWANRNRFVPLGLLLCLLAGLWQLGRGGPDYEHYIAWAEAARTGAIFVLPGDQASPVGLPFSQWSFGPGLVFAAVAWLAGLSSSTGSLLAGWFCSVALWITLVALLRRSRVGSAWIILGLAFAFLGTHLGFYSHVHASESLSLGCMGIMAWLVFGTTRHRYLDALVVGVLGGLLIIVRPQLGLYALIGVTAFGWQARAAGARWRRIFIGSFVMAVPIVLSVAQLLMVNRWMTGSFGQSPYDFGNGDFTSLDIRHPHFDAVLWNPWHGLLRYHPLYARKYPTHDLKTSRSVGYDPAHGNPYNASSGSAPVPGRAQANPRTMAGKRFVGTCLRWPSWNSTG